MLAIDAYKTFLASNVIIIYLLWNEILIWSSDLSFWELNKIKNDM